MSPEAAERFQRWNLWRDEREITLGRSMTDDEWAKEVWEPWQQGKEPPPLWLERVRRENDTRPSDQA